MRKWKISQGFFDRAKEWTSFEDTDRTIKKGSDYRTWSAFAEMNFAEQYDCIRISHLDKQADFVMPDKTRIDVKCICKGYDPRPEWHVKVNAYQKKFNVDIYHFYWYNFIDHTLFELGYIEKDIYFNSAELRKKGEFANNSIIAFLEDFYELEISKLNDTQD